MSNGLPWPCANGDGDAGPFCCRFHSNLAQTRGVVGALERDVELGAVRIRLAVLEQGGQADGLLDIDVVAWRVPLDDDVGRRDLGR
jgi:hypothetical protein